MKVTGVPGVAAFGGNVDEDVAYGAANQAGLILFLITPVAAIVLDAGAQIKSGLDQRKADNQCIQYRQNIRAECADIARQMENEVQAITEAYIREVLTEPMERMQEYADRMNDERRKQNYHMQRPSRSELEGAGTDRGDTRRGTSNRMNRIRSNNQRRQDPPVPIPSATRQPSAGPLSSDSGSYPSEFAWQPDPGRRPPHILLRWTPDTPASS